MTYAKEENAQKDFSKTMNWCFAIVNNHLAELFFERDKKQTRMIGYSYVKRTEYRTKQEQKWIREDTKKDRFTYRKGKYYFKPSGKKDKPTVYSSVPKDWYNRS